MFCVGSRWVASVPTVVGTRRYLALHPVGFAWPASSPRPPVRSYRTLSPLTPTEPERSSGIGTGLLSVARAFRTASIQNNGVFCRWRCSLPVRKHGPCGVRTFLTADADSVGLDGATTQSARHTVNAHAPIKVRGTETSGPRPVKKRSGSGSHLRTIYYRSTFSFISSMVSL